MDSGYNASNMSYPLQSREWGEDRRGEDPEVTGNMMIHTGTYGYRIEGEY